MPNFSFSTASNFLRFTPESLDGIRKRLAEKKEKERHGETIEEEIIQPQLDLKACKKLPALYGKPPPWLIGEPLEDLDPYYKTHETFLVLTSRRRIFRFTANKALFLFSPFNPLRRLAIKISIHTCFIVFITCVVLVNSVLMALLASPSNCDSFEIFFAVTYTVEFVIKVVARGFVWNEFTYLRDPWNHLDLFVLIMTNVALCNENLGSISTLRIFKVLRTFKAVSVLPGLKVIVDSLFQSVKKLANVMLLTVFCLSVFALVGLQLFMGTLKNRCVVRNMSGGNITINCKKENLSYYLMNDACDPLLCYNFPNSTKSTCPEPYICMKTECSPNYGYTSFDNFGWAFLSLFRLMTQDSWEVLYRQVIRSSGKSFSFFFVVVIFMCSFYLFNLIMAVVIMAYEDQQKATVAHTKARELLLQEAKEVLRKEQESIARRHELSSGENMEMPGIESDKKERKSKRKWKLKKKPKTYGEDETMFYSTPDKSQKELKEILTSYDLPVDIANDPFQRQKLTSAANVLSKSMEWEESKLEFPPGLKRAAQKYLIWQCCPFWLRIKKMMKKITMNPFTEILITLCIIVNTLIMALEHTVLCPEVVSRANYAFTVIFTIEMILKTIALDPYYYFQRAWNIFDFLIVVIGIVSSATGMHLSFFRLLRIFKLSRFWPALNKLMKIMLKSVGPLGNLTLVLIFTMFIFALVGMQGFGTFYNKTGCKSCEIVTSSDCRKKTEILPSSDCRKEIEMCVLRWHMNDFFHSFLIIFRILCGEWINTMWDCMQITKKEGWCVILFMTVLVVGNLVVLNLFIALLLSSFSSSAVETEATNPSLHLACAHIRSGLQCVKHWLWDLCCNGLLRKLKRKQNKNVTMAIHNASQKKCATEMKEIQENYAINEISRYWDKPTTDGEQEDFMPNYNKCVTVPLAEEEFLSDEEDCTITQMDNRNELRHRREQHRKSRNGSSQFSEAASILSLEVPRRPDLDTSGSEASTVEQTPVPFLLPERRKEPEDCFPKGCVKIFPCCVVNSDTFPGSTWWRFRKTCFKIIKHSWFEYFIIFIIILSSFTLTFEDIYLKDRKVIKTILDYADKVFFYIFFLEMLLKWVAYGFKKYFTNAWCWLDFFIVCTSLASLVAEAKSTEYHPCDNRSSIKSLRTLRALRPLRALSRFKGIKVVVNALIGAIPSIANVLLVCVVLWLPFNILGVSLFGGKSGRDKVGVVCKENYSWVNNTFNFNHIGNGYLALLQVATFKGWTDIMYAAVDGPQEDGSLCFEGRKYAYLYFVAFIIFGSFFMLNLFIGVVIDNFNQQRKKLGGELIFLSEDQKKYYNALKKLGNKKLQKPIPRPNNKYQGFFFDLISKKAFDIFILSLIFLNVVVMAVESEGQGTETKNLLSKINQVFVTIFTGECLMKIFALRHYYFRDGWNIFDFVVVILSITSLAATSLEGLFPPTLLRVIRVARISRLLRLVRGARGLQTLLFALLMSLPALANIGLLLFLVMFIYAIFGMTNFACAAWKNGIDEIFNFQTFSGSMLCLFQITTSAGWDSLLRPMLDGDSTCAPNLNLSQLNSPCVNSTLASTYFISYIIISFLIVVNMYVAVIIENFNVATEESTEPLSDYDFEVFYETWAKFDPQATQFITYSALSDFASALEDPLRIPKPNKQQLLAMTLPMVNGNKIHCLDVLLAFTKRVLGQSGDMGSLETHIESKYMKANPQTTCCEPIITTPKRKEEECAIVIQRAFRIHQLQCALQKARDEFSVNIPLADIIEEEDAYAFGLKESEGSLLDKCQSPSSVSIPPSYSNVTGTVDGSLQVKVSDSSDDDK